MAEYLNNPAGRLRSFILELHAAYPQPNAQSSVMAWDAVAQLLVPGMPLQSPQVVIAIGRVLALPGEVRRAVGSLDLDDPEDEAQFLEGLDAVEGGLALITQRNHLLSHVFECFAPGGQVLLCGAIQSLAHCSRELRRCQRTDGELSTEDLEQIAEAITNLVTEVGRAQLDGALRVFLLDHLFAMLRAAHLVRVTGTGPLEGATDALLGQLRRHPDTTAGLQRTGFLARIGEVLAVINAAVAVSTGSVALTQTVLGALPE